MALSGRLATAVVSAKVLALTQGVLRTMVMTKVKIAVIAFLALGVTIGGVGNWAYHALAAVPTYTPGGFAGPESRIDGQDDDAKKPTKGPAGNKSVGKALKRETVVGSGKVVTKEYQITGFNSLDFGSTFEVEISQGDAFKVSVTADDNLFDYIKAVKEDSTLYLSLDSKDKSIQNFKSLKALVTLPSLRDLKMSGVTHVTLKDFKSSSETGIHIDGASNLKGSLDTKKFVGEISGASHMDLKSSTSEAKLNASGASDVELKGSATGINLEASGASHVNLANFAVDEAKVDLSGASHATIQVKSKLSYEVSGASHLTYQGNPTIGEKEKSGGSSVTHKK
jgi:hypothetical protein